MEFYLVILSSILISLILFSKFNLIADKIGLIDNKNPNYTFKPTPTGAGIIFIIIFFLGNIIFYFSDEFRSSVPNRYYLLILSSLILSVTSFRDDIKNVDPILRLLIQFVCIYISLSCLSLNQIDIPFKLSILIVFGMWVYITNITNFIDGTDGFLVTHALFFFLNIFLSCRLTIQQTILFWVKGKEDGKYWCDNRVL